MSEPVQASRRAVLGAPFLVAGTSAVAAAAPVAAADEAEARRILERYHGFGVKASGGPGDTATGVWLEDELRALGYATARQTIETPAYEGEATLTCGAATADLIPQAHVQTTPGLTAPLSLGGGGISILALPYARWSTAKGDVARRVHALFAKGAQAVVIVTTGPSGEALALNAPVDAPLFDRPVAVLAPKAAEPFLQAAARGETATIAIPGRAFRRPAFNVTAKLDRKAAKWLVISTPRSGWFTCAGERGTGVAAWLMLVKWAATAKLPVNVAVIATTGHEYEYAGGEAFIHALAPKPRDTALWVHLGANVAARDWHERGTFLSPLPSMDPQHFLLVSHPLAAASARAFAGMPGLEQVYEADPRQAAGELGSILAAGYDPVMGIFGSHRFHHARNDDLRCVSAALAPPVAHAFAQVIAGALKA
ncbi:MAG: hypothetical protein JNL41_21240 [Phenylobacterium sp.]|uniref:hypothetical protein n=1 Tax=Phenylobacterium sp. TaxID=1871053 RepID=UPI001A4B98CA|nr:hypothetical protein [Phenylobacterium sp.]MBL8556810.1 hypothetical protein [Phenylobacterium sp.]